jgi:YidC/Oxa1 family membrane protein insertase
MEKRVFLAILLSFGVLWLYQSYLAPPPAPMPAGDVATSQTAPPVAAAPPGVPVPAAPGEPAVPEPAPVQVLVADTAARDIVVETNTIYAVFDTRGATLRSWRLKHYADQAGEPLELVPSDLPEAMPRPFTIATDAPDLSLRLATALFRPSNEGLSLGDAAGTLRFEYSDASGLNARKTFHFQPDAKPYIVNVEASVDVNGTSKPVTIEWGPALSLGYSLNGGTEVPARGILFRDGDVDRLSASDLTETPTYEGVFRLAGVEEHYFMSVALPATQSVKIGYTPITLPVPGATDDASRQFVAYRITVPPGAPTIPFFLGPKELDVLRGVDPQLVYAIDFGIFRVLVVPLLQALKSLNSVIDNYGFSIVALTVIINLLIFPLRHRSMVSMRKMQALQPEVKAIQKRYEKFKITDPERQKMNSEMMGLYKKKGVNPASGCLPMLLTMPVLFAFYSMLQVAIELRGAPFFGWIHDLSARDPYFVWPLLMGGTMFWQQRLTPTTLDPVQARVLTFMPIMFTVMFLWFPSGLVIYWLTSNLMAVGQQYLTNNMLGKPAPPPAPEAPSKRSKS